MWIAAARAAYHLPLATLNVKDAGAGDGGEVEAEFAREYAATPRIVFSDSLESVAPGCRLVRRADAVDEVVRLKKETDGDLSAAAPVWLHRC